MPPTNPAEIITREKIRQTGESIAELQLSSGMIPWFPNGHADPWNHIEAAMALDVAELHDELAVIIKNVEAAVVVLLELLLGRRHLALADVGGRRVLVLGVVLVVAAPPRVLLCTCSYDPQGWDRSDLESLGIPTA